MDDLDIYGDLEKFDAKVQNEQNNVALQELQEKYDRLLRQLETEQATNQKLREKKDAMKHNFHSLMATAKKELARKDAQIQDLRKERDDIAFRRDKSHSFGHQRDRPDRYDSPPPAMDLGSKPNITNFAPPVGTSQEQMQFSQPPPAIPGTSRDLPDRNVKENERRGSSRDKDRNNHNRREVYHSHRHESSSRRHRSRDRSDRDKHRSDRDIDRSDRDKDRLSSSRSRSSRDRSSEKYKSRKRSRSRHSDRSRNRSRRRSRTRDRKTIKEEEMEEESSDQKDEIESVRVESENTPNQEPALKRTRRDETESTEEIVEVKEEINEVETAPSANIDIDRETPVETADDDVQEVIKENEIVAIPETPLEKTIEESKIDEQKQTVPEIEISVPTPETVAAEDTIIPDPEPVPEPPRTLTESVVVNFEPEAKAEKRSEPLVTSFTGSLERFAKEGMFVKITTDRTTNAMESNHTLEKEVVENVIEPEEMAVVGENGNSQEREKATESIPMTQSPEQTRLIEIETPNCQDEEIPSSNISSDLQPNTEPPLPNSIPMDELPPLPLEIPAEEAPPPPPANLHPHLNLMPSDDHLPMMVVPREAVQIETFPDNPSPSVAIIVTPVEPPKVATPKINIVPGLKERYIVKDQATPKEVTAPPSDLTLDNLTKHNQDLELDKLAFIMSEFNRIGGPEIANDPQLIKSYQQKQAEEEKRRLEEEQREAKDSSSSVAHSHINGEMRAMKDNKPEDESNNQKMETTEDQKPIITSPPPAPGIQKENTCIVMGHSKYNYAQGADGQTVLVVSRLKKKKRKSNNTSV